MNPFVETYSPRPIGRRHVCRLFANAGAAAVWGSLARRNFAQSGAVPVSGKNVPPLREFDGLLFDYLRRNPSIPGASLAIARQGRVIYARAFGWASLEEHAAAQPDSLFRVASVSKTLTAAAIVLLVQRGRLKLSEPAFPLLRLEEPPNKPTPADPRLDRITIHHLLCHTGGWARTTAENPFETWKGFDPMFFPVEIARTLEVPSPASPRDIVRFMLTRPLDFDPGTRYAYSNFGYCVLGRVIESVSGVCRATAVLIPLRH